MKSIDDKLDMKKNKTMTISEQEEEKAKKLGFLSAFQMRSYEASLKAAEELKKNPMTREQAIEQAKWVDEQREINRRKELENLED